MWPKHNDVLSEQNRRHVCCFFFFFNDTATTEIYTLSLHDALPIFMPRVSLPAAPASERKHGEWQANFSGSFSSGTIRSEEHTSELQSQSNLVCRLLLEKKKKKTIRLIRVV